jgi:hypothetical protein
MRLLVRLGAIITLALVYLVHWPTKKFLDAVTNAVDAELDKANKQ